jgi:hypothetical protein
MKARWILISPLRLNDRERLFVKDMVLRMSEPTQRQWAWLNSLTARMAAL